MTLSSTQQLRAAKAQLQALQRGGGETVGGPAQVPDGEQGPENGAFLQEEQTPGQHHHKHAVPRVDDQEVTKT